MHCLSLRICLFWTACVNRVIEYVVSCDSLLSLGKLLHFIPILGRTSTAFLLTAGENSCRSFLLCPSAHSAHPSVYAPPARKLWDPFQRLSISHEYRGKVFSVGGAGGTWQGEAGPAASSAGARGEKWGCEDSTCSLPSHGALTLNNLDT